MKNKKSLRILIAALAFAILAVALCFAAFAEETPELSVKILAKNVAYDEVVKVLFAVDDTAAGGNEVEVIYYVEDPTVNTQAKAYAGIKYEVGYTDKNGTPDDTSDDVKYPAFFTAGFPAANIGDNVYARAHIVGTDVYSDVVRYSVVEYLLERLYQDKAEGDKKALYETLLDYGEYSQKVILNGDADPDNDVERFVTEYVLVTMSEGGIDETPDNKRDASYPTGIYFVGDKIYPTSKEVKSWKVTVGDTSKVVKNAAEVVVSGFTTITVNEYANATPAYKPDLNDTEGRETFEGEEVINADPWAPEGGKAEIVDGTPYGEDSKVYYLGSNNKSTQEVSFRVNEKDEDANVIWFESDMMILPYSTGNVEIHIRSKTNAGYIFYFGLDPDGNVVLKDKNTTDIATLAPAGEWFRFGFKYATQDDGKAALAFYYNEERVAASADLEGAFTVEQLIADTGDPRIRVRFMSWSATVCDHYFDNVKLDVIKSDDYAITVDPTVPDPDQPGEGGEGEDGPTVPTNPVDPTYKPDLTDTAGRETYDDNNLTDVFKEYDLWIDGAAAGSKIEIVDGKPYGTDSKVYYYHTVAGFKPEINMKFNVVSGANAARFETDLMLDPDVADNIQFIFGSGSAGVNCFWFESTEEGDIYLLAKDESRIAKVAVAGEWFRLTVEYLEYEDGTRAFKFYVNEKRVGEGRVFAGDQAISQFQKFRVWSEPDYVGDIYFDNTKVEFYTHTEEPEIPTTPEEPEELEPVHPNYKPDLTDTEGRETYEDDDLTNVFVKFDNWHDGQGEGAYVIDDGAPYGENSKVYHYSAAEGYKPEVSMVFNPVAGTNAVRFETDIMFKPVTANKIQFILGSGSTGVNCFYFTSDADGYIYLLAKDETEIAKVAIAGEWFRFAVEYLEFEGSVYEFRFFINDERVGADKVFAGEQAVSSVKKLRFWSEKAYIGEIFFDNSKVELYTHEEELEDPYVPDFSDLATRETYEDGDALDQFKWNSWHGNQGDSAYGIVDGKPYGIDSKVYNLNTADGYKPEIAFEWTKVSTNVVAYETDMMITTTGTLTPEISLRENGSTAIFVFYMRTKGDKVELLDSGNQVIATIADDGEWFRFRIEYIDGTDGTATVKFYINDVQLPETCTATGSASAIGRVKFWTQSTHVGNVYFDNTKIEFEAFKAPETDGSDDTEVAYKPDLTDTEGRETYEDGDSLDTFKFDNGATTEIVSDAPYGEASKVYKYIKTDNSKVNEINIKPLSKPTGTNTFVFESDIKFVANSAATIEIQIRGNSSVGIGYTLFLSVTNDGDVVIKDQSNSAIATIAKAGEWFRLGIGYGTTAEGSGVLLYVNGEQINEAPLAASKNVADFDRIRFMGHTASVFDFYLDNTKAQYVVK